MMDLRNMDCMKLMSEFEDKHFDVAIVDPPYFKGVAKKNFYGSDISTTGIKRLSSKSDHWDSNIPTAEYFKELIRVSKHQIVWGCNYYPFEGMGKGVLVWDKKNDDSTFSNCELASITLIDSVKIFRYMWNGMLQENMKEKEFRIHPTQKPIKLYQWILENYCKPTDKILDTHLGSGSIAIACHYFGCDLTASEIDKNYFDLTMKRIKECTVQEKMF